MPEPTPCIITVAITGSLPRKENNPAVPITIAEQVESTQEAFEAGATLAHLHVRNDDQTLDLRPGEVRAASRRAWSGHCPGMILQFSTGGRSGAGQERGGMLPLKPDMASLATGSCNFPTRVYENSPDLIDWLAAEMLAHDVKPEIEAFDLSMIFKAVEMAAGRQDQGPAARSVRHGREERDAGRPRGVRVLRRDAEAPGAGRDLDRCRHRQGPAHAQPLVARARRPLPHRSRGQCPLGPDPAGAPPTARWSRGVAELCAEYGRRPATVAEARALLHLRPAA